MRGFFALVLVSLLEAVVLMRFVWSCCGCDAMRLNAQHVDELVAALTTREWLGIHAFSRDRPTTLSAMRAASVNDTNGSSDEPATEKLEAECTLAKLPLFYDAQQAAAGEQREIEVFAKRLRGTGPAPRKSLWLLQVTEGRQRESSWLKLLRIEIVLFACAGRPRRLFGFARAGDARVPPAAAGL